MCGSIACIAVMIVGIDAGWKPLPEGGIEYHIQLEPHVLETLRAGRPVHSYIPPHLQNVRELKITVGNEQLARELPPQQEGARFAATEPPSGQETRPEDRATNPAFPGSPVTPPRLEGSLAGAWSGLQRSGLPVVPRQIHPDPKSKPLGGTQQASHDGPTSSAAKIESKSPSHQGLMPPDSARAEPHKPPVPFTVTLFTLFGSLGANMYLGWVVWGTRRRYRTLVDDVGAPSSEGQ